MARAEDVYPYVATTDIYHGTVCAFRKGDPIPESTVQEQGWADEDPPMAVLRAEWEDRPEDEPERPMKRGDMPPHLREAAKSTEMGSNQTSSKPATKTSKKADS